MQQVDLTKFLPQSIKTDKKIFAVAKSLNQSLNDLLTKSELVLHLPRLDKLPEDVLDHLAYQFHADFYKSDLPVDAKRNLIRETIFWHRIKGTPAGVEKILSTFLSDVKVEEWFEYGGEPYFFRVNSRGLKHLELDEEFLKLIFEAKNIRSWLERLQFDIRENEIDYFAHIELNAGQVTTDIADPPRDLNKIQQVFHGVIEFDCGMEITDIATPPEALGNIFHAIIELEGGIDTTDIYEEFWDKPWDYGGEDNPDIPELFPDQDFLRLYFNFPKGYNRYLTLFNPKDDISDRDINALGSLVRKNGLLKNSSGYFAQGIKRALLIKKTFEKLFGTEVN